MAQISIEHLSFSYPSSFDPIFTDVSLTLDTSWKLGFVGRNGRGKTTFLRLLTGQYEYSGRIVSPVGFDYFPFPVPAPERPAAEILAPLCPDAAGWQLERELSLLGVHPGALDQSFSTLSNGEQTKALLAALFLREGRFLLIDEPTNHLDAAARAKVSAYLGRKQGFILVSHDRRFLDGCVDHILALNRADIQLQSGNYSAWQAGFDQQQARDLAQNEKLKKDIRRLEASARRTALWADRVEASKIGAADKGYVGHKAAKMMKRAKTVEARQHKAMEEKAALLKNQETAEPLRLAPLVHFAPTLAAFSDVTVCYDGRTVCGPVSFEVTQGSRVALCGGNGSGKTSLLRLLAGENVPHTGTVTTAPGLVISQVPQNAAGLAGNLRDYARAEGLDESLFKAILRKMDFSRVQFEKDMAGFSSGQKKKVLLARSLCQRAHLYLWDEPMNFIDLYTRLQLERLLGETSLTLLFVEHDAAFREAIATRTVNL